MTVEQLKRALSFYADDEQIILRHPDGSWSWLACTCTGSIESAPLGPAEDEPVRVVELMPTTLII